MNVLKSFIRDESGQDMVEYGLLAAFISVIAIIAIQAIGDLVSDKFDAVKAALEPAGS